MITARQYRSGSGQSEGAGAAVEFDYLRSLNINKESNGVAPASQQHDGHERDVVAQPQPSSTAPLPSALRNTSRMSPPLTPKTSNEALPQRQTESQTETFHNYLRAFYHFHPSSTVSSTGDESSITVPINQGDVILVHSVHPNGWADGTLLASGNRGWLPTNYCEPYDPSEIRNLLNSLTNLWDLVRSPEHESLLVFSRQDYVRGMIAGVRYFLVSAQPSRAAHF